MDVTNETFKQQTIDNLATAFVSCDFYSCVIIGKLGNFVQCRFAYCTFNVDEINCISCNFGNCTFSNKEGMRGSFRNCIVEDMSLSAIQEMIKPRAERKVLPFLTLPYWQWS